MGNAARLSQHYLIDEGAAQAIVDSSLAGPGKRVLEIGPGRGILTGPLLESGAEVTAVELDDRLYGWLNEKLVPRGLSLLHADFLRFDLGRLGDGPYTVVANLPYAVGAPILQKLLPWGGWTDAVLMFQKEVALRLCSRPGGADYGLLTLSTLLWASAEYLLEVPRTSFRPAPQVSSGVVRLVRRPEPRVAPEKQAAFFRLAKAAFAQRRKMAAPTIGAAAGRPRAEVEAEFARLGIDKTVRPENIPFEAWAALAERFSAAQG
jgi:16S rRNA (adenine1518-N6/adenine1519-N6)-dimethyltransferase